MILNHNFSILYKQYDDDEDMNDAEKEACQSARTVHDSNCQVPETESSNKRTIIAPIPNLMSRHRFLSCRPIGPTLSLHRKRSA